MSPFLTRSHVDTPTNTGLSCSRRVHCWARACVRQGTHVIVAVHPKVSESPSLQKLSQLAHKRISGKYVFSRPEEYLLLKPRHVTVDAVCHCSDIG